MELNEEDYDNIYYWCEYCDIDYIYNRYNNKLYKNE